MPADLSRRAYVDAMVAYGRALLAPRAAERRNGPVADVDCGRWLDRMVEYGRRLRRSVAATPPGRQSGRGLDDFRRLFMKDPQWLRRRVEDGLAARRAGLASEAQQWLRVLETTPDLLGPMEYVRYEPIYTRVLAWALTPSVQPGGLGDAPLRALLEWLASAAPVRVPSADEAIGAVTVVAEKGLGKFGRADVWLELRDVVIVIEAKVDASEGHEQVSKYRRAVDRYAPGKEALLVFLTPDGDDSTSDEVAVPLSFEELLRLWLPLAAAGDSGEHTYLRHYLKSIAHHVSELTGAGPYDAWTSYERRRALSFLEESVP